MSEAEVESALRAMNAKIDTLVHISEMQQKAINSLADAARFHNKALSLLMRVEEEAQ